MGSVFSHAAKAEPLQRLSPKSTTLPLNCKADLAVELGKDPGLHETMKGKITSGVLSFQAEKENST